MWDLNANGLPSPWIIALIFALVVWSIAWKGYALWLAARNEQPWWFVVLLIANTAAILDIIYIFAVGRPELKKRSLALPAHNVHQGENASSSSLEVK